jgi:molecular chaperone GrpE
MPDETITTENNEQAGVTADPAEIDTLRKLAAERDQYLDMAQRARAEFENYQKRARKEREDERRYLNFAFALDLLPVLDNLERALQAAQQAGDAGPLAQGVALVQTQFLEQLKRHGVTPIDAQDKPFDPNLHQAVMQQPSDQVEPNTVLQVLERGYTIHERVLRPAKVIVSSRP